MPEDMEIPLSMSQRLEQEPPWPGYNEGKLPFPADSPKWFDKEWNEKLREKYTWAAPFDPRFPQMNQSKHCFTYYVDYHRCLNLKGEDYKPCQYFKNIYMDMCPRYWVNRWDDWVEEGKFPAKFDR